MGTWVRVCSRWTCGECGAGIPSMWTHWGARSEPQGEASAATGCESLDPGGTVTVGRGGFWRQRREPA